MSWCNRYGDPTSTSTSSTEREPRPHHLGYYVDDIDDAAEAMAARGYEVVQSGSGFGVDGDGAFAYFDTVHDFGCYYEAIVGPRALPDPEARIPLLGDHA